MHGPTVLQTTFRPRSNSVSSSTRVPDLDDLVVGGADPRHVVEHILDARPVTARRDERHVVLAQELGDEPAGEAARAVDDDRPASDMLLLLVG